jgi:predicted dehydrogenase
MLNRRQFLQTSAGAAALGAYVASAPVVHAADKAGTYTLAIVGTGWWGTNILREALASGRSKLLAMCDVDTRQLDKSWGDVKSLTSDEPKRYADFREMLQKEKPQIVINATPDHWHALVMIEAVKSGAHVYVEKPISHTVLEGKAMVAAARAADRVVQVGTHRRIAPHNVSGRDFLRSGKAGKIGSVRAFVHYGGNGPEQPSPNMEPPKEMNWDMWCGPAPLRPYNRRLAPKGFRQFLDYANGTLGDWGVHWLDQILWVTGRRYPKTVFSAGGRIIKGAAVNTKEAQTTDAPDHLVSTFQFDDGFTAHWEHREYAANNAEKTHPQQPVGCYFYGTEGTFHMGWLDGWTFYPADPRKPPVHEDAKLNKPDDQNIKELWADFINAIESNKRPTSDVEEIHYSTNMALLGILSYKLGRSVQWDGEKTRIVGDEEANKLLRRDYRGEWKYPEV